MSVYCRNCGAKAEETDLFCRMCGTKRIKQDFPEVNKQPAKFCMQCGNKMKADELFCAQCGTKQIATTAMTEATATNPMSVAVTSITAVETARTVAEPPVPIKVKTSEEISQKVQAEVKDSNKPKNETKNAEDDGQKSTDKKAKPKRKKKVVAFAICGIVFAVCALAILTFFYLNCEKGLMNVKEVEEKLNEAYVKMWEGTIDYEGVTEFKIEDVNKETYDQTFSCVVVPSSDGVTGLEVLGLVKNGQVVQLQSIYIGDEAKVEQLDDELKSVLTGMVVFPLSIFKENIDTLDEYIDFIEYMDVVDNATSGPEMLRYVDGDIECTYIRGSGNGVVAYMFTVRYMPAFSSGFFEEENDTALYNDKPVYEDINNSSMIPQGSTQESSKETEPSDDHIHNYSVWKDDSNDSTHSRACFCGKIQNENHSFDTGTITKEPTNSATGIRTYVCKKCSAVKEEIIANLQHIHNFGGWENSTTTQHAKSCSCGEKKIEDHTFDSGKVTKEPTETALGVKTYTCTKCGAIKTETLDKLKHTHAFGNWTSNGNTEHSRYCSCGEKETENHTFDSGKVTKEATETDTGVKTYTCTKCAETKTETIDKLPHTHSYTYYKDDENGSTCSRFCSCGETITSLHNWDMWYVSADYTTRTRSCLHCRRTEKETLDWGYDLQVVCACGLTSYTEHIVVYPGSSVTKMSKCGYCSPVVVYVVKRSYCDTFGNAKITVEIR